MFVPQGLTGPHADPRPWNDPPCAPHEADDWTEHPAPMMQHAPPATHGAALQVVA